MASPRVFLVGIGGPTCSGKTTLTKHLVNLLTRHASSSKVQVPVSTFIIHQDDFAPPESSLVWNEKVGSADWDDPSTSVEWTRLRNTVEYVKRTGRLPEDHSSHDELNPLPDLSITQGVQRELDELFERKFASSPEAALPTHIVFLDGFLLYYDEQLRNQIDLSIFLRIGRDLLKERRESRGGYVTAEGECWKDPPLYFDEILWPSHLKAHAHLFENQDVESGQLVPSESGTKPLQVIEAQDPPGKGSPKKIDDIIKQGCEALLSSLSHWQQQHEQKGSVS